MKKEGRKEKGKEIMEKRRDDKNNDDCRVQGRREGDCLRQETKAWALSPRSCPPVSYRAPRAMRCPCAERAFVVARGLFLLLSLPLSLSGFARYALPGLDQSATSYALSGTNLRVCVLPGWEDPAVLDNGDAQECIIVLRACYAMSGTDVAYGATRSAP
eukprot:2167003-Rhodomonas_salina.2